MCLVAVAAVYTQKDTVIHSTCSACCLLSTCTHTLGRWKTTRARARVCDGQAAATAVEAAKTRPVAPPSDRAHIKTLKNDDL